MSRINIRKIENGYIVTVHIRPKRPETFFTTAPGAVAFILKTLEANEA